MDVSGEPATLPRGKSPRYPLERRLGRSQSLSSHRGEENKSLPRQRIEPSETLCRNSWRHRLLGRQGAVWRHVEYLSRLTKASRWPGNLAIELSSRKINKGMKLTLFKEAVIHGSFLILLFVLYDAFHHSLVLISSLRASNFQSRYVFLNWVSVSGFSGGRMILQVQRLSVTKQITERSRCRGQEYVDLYLHSRNTSWWHGA